MHIQVRQRGPRHGPDTDRDTATDSSRLNCSAKSSALNTEVRHEHNTERGSNIAKIDEIWEVTDNVDFQGVRVRTARCVYRNARAE